MSNPMQKLAQYERRAAGVRKIAGRMPDAESARLLRSVAKQYVRMAKWLARGHASVFMDDTASSGRDAGGEA